MKYLKICSFAVLSLLLFAPAAMADVECEVDFNNQRLREESQHEKLEDIEVTCRLDDAADIAVTAATADEDDASTTTVNESMTGGDMFDLELEFPGTLNNTDADDDDNDMPIMLMLMDADGTADGVGNIGDNGYRTGVDSGIIVGDSVYWEDIVFPAHRGSVTTTLSFMIRGVYIDANSVDDDRLEVTLDMNSNLASNEDFDADSSPVAIARITMALDLDFVGSGKAFAINACDPAEVKDFEVELIEGFREGWKADNEILLMVSSGTIASEGSSKFEVDIDRAVDDELVLSVREDDEELDTGPLKITFQPATGNSGQELVLTARFLRARGSDERFAVSDTLVVGTYGACKGDTLTFPFISNHGGFDTGVVLVNMSDVDGECELMWDGMAAGAGQTKDVMDVDKMSQAIFTLGGMNGVNPDFQGYLKAVCTFTKAHGYAFLTDYVNQSGAQGYLAIKE